MVSSWWRMAVSGKRRPPRTTWVRCSGCGKSHKFTGRSDGSNVKVDMVVCSASETLLFFRVPWIGR